MRKTVLKTGRVSMEIQLGCAPSIDIVRKVRMCSTSREYLYLFKKSLMEYNRNYELPL